MSIDQLYQQILFKNTERDYITFVCSKKKVLQNVVLKTTIFQIRQSEKISISTMLKRFSSEIFNSKLELLNENQMKKHFK